MIARVLISGCVVLSILTATSAMSEEPAPPPPVTSEAHKIVLKFGKSMVVDVPAPISRASLANPDVADALVLSPRQVYVTGKTIGTTNLTIWQKNEQILAVYDVEVQADLTRLK